MVSGNSVDLVSSEQGPVADCREEVMTVWILQKVENFLTRCAHLFDMEGSAPLQCRHKLQQAKGYVKLHKQTKNLKRTREAT